MVRTRKHKTYGGTRVTNENIHTLVEEYLKGNVNHLSPIGEWDVSEVTNMSGLFRNSTFDEDIGRWDTSRVTDMSFMFQGSTFNKPLPWKTDNVVNMKI